MLATMQIRELNHVALLVSDVGRSCEFYLHVMKLEPIPRPAFDFPGAWFRLGTNQELHLIGGRTEQIVSGNRSNHLALLTDDLVEWEQHFANVRADFQPRKLRPDGAEQIFLRDPDGHAIELCTPPPR